MTDHKRLFHAISEAASSKSVGELVTFARQEFSQVDFRDDPAHYGMAFDRLIFAVTSMPDLNEVARLTSDLSLEDRARNGDTPWNLLGNGVSCFVRNDIENAYAYFSASASLPLEGRFHNSLGVYNARSHRYVEGGIGAAPQWLSPLQWRQAHEPKPDDIVHVFCCDSRYLETYAGALIASSVKIGGDPLIHAHLINPSPADFDRLAHYAERTGGRVNATYEQTDVDRLPPHKRKGYYICPRFLYAPQIMAAYDRPLFITEADCRLTVDWQTIRQKLGEYDVCLNEALHARYPWRRIGAQMVFINTTGPGRAYCERTYRYLASVFDWDWHQQNWLIDQNALWSVRDHHLRSGLEGRFGSFRTKDLAFIELAQTYPGGKDAFARELAI